MMRLATSVLLVLLLILLVACDTKATGELLEEAEAAIAAGDSAAAMVHLKNALQKEPGNVSALLQLADLNLAAGDARTAESQYRRAAQLGASEIEFQLGLLKALLQQEKFQAVLDEVDPATVIATSQLPVILRLRGRAYAGLGLLAEAAAALQNSIELEPDLPDAHADLAEVYLRLHREDEADEEIARALTSDAEHPPALFVRGRRELSADNVEAAEASFQQAARLAEQRNSVAIRFRALAALADIQLNQERTDEAAATNAALAGINAGRPLVKYHGARIADQRGDRDEAKRLLQEVLAAQEDFRPAQRMLGTFYALEGSYDLAEMHLQPIVNSDPNDVFARRMLATVRLGQERPDEALALLEEAADSDSPEAQRGFFALAAQASLQSGDTEKAISYFRAGAAADPADWRFQLGQALTLLAEGQHGQAIKLIEGLDERAGPYRKPSLLIFAYLQDERAEDALSLATQLVEEQPEQTYSHNLLGTVYLLTGAPTEAREHLLHALELDSRDIGSLANLARAEAQLDKLDAALAALLRVIELDPDNAWARIALARYYISESQPEEALRVVEPVLEISLDAQLLVSAIEFEQGDTAGARETVQRVLQTDIKSARAYTLLGRMDSAAGDYDAAIRNFTTATRLQPARSGLYLNLARAQLANGDQEAARVAIADARARDPNSSELAVLEVVLFMRDGDYVRAERLLDNLRKSDFDPVTRLSMLGDLRTAQKQYSEAAEAYNSAYAVKPSQGLALGAWRAEAAAGHEDPTATLRDWLEQAPDDFAVLTAVGNWHLARREVENAQRYLERAVEIDRSHALALNNLAWIYGETGDDRALPTAEQAYRLLPDSPAIADTIGWIHLKSGNAEAALGFLKQAAEAVPLDPGIQYHLAMAYVETDDPEPAKKILADLVESHQDFPDRQAAEQALAEL
jgi:putative PEP-CTERM system TPR-repeat lipoprotein